MDRFQKLVWGGLVATLVAIAVIYFVTDARRSPLPVISRITAFAATNQLGAAVGPASWRGQVVVVNVIFSRCPTQCPKLTQQMAQVQSSIGPGVRLVTLTADPVFDTPEVLKRYAQRNGADPAKWWFLTGTKAEIYRLAVSDLKFSVLESANPAEAKLEDLFIHTTDFALVDRAGRLRAVVHGEEPDAPAQIAALVKQLLRETSL
ncbi:MAG TPA: SCO family protein [Candidatus Limnocylindria bacterium]|nr:SCO family protein [Candidatus Limnocylindria bacterium]